MLRKSFFILALIIIAAAIPISAFSSNATCIEEPIPKVIYQIDESHPPFEFSTGTDVYGFGLDLGKMIFGAGNFNVHYSADTWSNVYTRIVEGDIDICGLLAVTEGRKKDILFTKPVVKTYRAIYSRKNVEITRISDISGYRIGVQHSDYAEAILKDELGIIDYLTFRDLEECIFALQDGRIDVVFGNQEVTNCLLVRHQMSNYITPQILNLYPTDLAFGVSKSRPELVPFMNAQIDKLQKSGLYEQVFQKYFYRHSEYYKANQQNKLFYLGLFLLLIVIATLLFSNAVIKQLRKMVDKATSGLKKEHELLRITLSSITDGVMAVNNQGRITFMNNVAEKLTGFSEKKSIDKPLEEVLIIVDTESGIRYDIPVTDVLEECRPITFNSLNILLSESGSQHLILGSASPIKNDTDNVIGVLLVFQDISEKMRSEETIKYHEYYDSLTDLPNRKLLNQYLNSAIENAGRNNSKLAVLTIDLDYFKNINNSLGHHIGDKLLQETSKRLIKILDKNDVLARMDGDEFTILMPEIDSAEQVYELAHRVLNELASSYVIDKHEMYITASIGISFYPDDATETTAILKHADTALYNAKANGRNTYQNYIMLDGEKVMERFALSKDLHTALERDEMLLHYQPKVDSYTKKVVGLEALLRWNHPERGLISPAVFIPLAEEIGLIRQFDSWVLKTACSQFMSLDNTFRCRMRLSVNISAYQFRNHNLADNVEQVLAETAIPPSQLELEITETAAMEDIDFTIKTLSRLNEMGVNISIDDFGTGYSSLNYLRNLPIHILKIDRSFICDMDKDLNTRVVVKAIIDVAHSLNLKVTAEGVETPKQLSLLKQMDCNEIQGYLISRPLPLPELLNTMLYKGLK